MLRVPKVANPKYWPVRVKIIVFCGLPPVIGIIAMLIFAEVMIGQNVVKTANQQLDQSATQVAHHYELVDKHEKQLNPSQIAQEAMEGIPLDDGSFMFILDEKNQIIASEGQLPQDINPEELQKLTQDKEQQRFNRMISGKDYNASWQSVPGKPYKVFIFAQTSEIKSKALYIQFVLLGIGTAITVLSLCISLPFGFWISSKMKKVTRLMTEIADGDGDLTQKIDLAPQHCSSIRDCGQTSCRSYGISTMCWEVSGSNSHDPDCPRVSTGKIASCYECNVMQFALGDEFDMLGARINQFVSSMHNVVADAQNNAVDVASAAAQIAAASEQISTDMNIQNEHTQQTSAAVEQMSSTITEVAEQSNHAAQQTQHARVSADECREGIQEHIKDIQESTEVVKQASDKIRELGEKSQQISEISNIISDIADQTNLLALNAAIEAARAGDHGRGFAVVADEVRKLAERTSQATEEIIKQIDEVQKGADEAVQQVNRGVERVQLSMETAIKSGEGIQAIVSQAAELEEMITSIAAATEEQSATMTEIANSTENLDRVSRESATAAAQASDAAVTLSHSASSLSDKVNQFSVHASAQTFQNKQATQLTVNGSQPA